MTQIKQVIELPVEDFELFKETNQKILRALQNLNIIPTTSPDYLTSKEFMDQCKVSRWKFDILKNSENYPVNKSGVNTTFPDQRCKPTSMANTPSMTKSKKLTCR